MAKTKTNKDGYEAVMAALKAQGHKSPVSALAKMLTFRRQTVHQWGGVIPEIYAFRVSLLSGVPMDVILPETVAAVKSAEPARPKSRNNANAKT